MLRKLCVCLFVVSAVFYESFGSEVVFNRFSRRSATEKNVRIIDLKSIIKGARLSPKDRRKFIAMQKNKKMLCREFGKILSNDRLLGFNSTQDKMHFKASLQKAIKSFKNPVDRDTLIAFLVAFQYKTNKMPNFTLSFRKGDDCCVMSNIGHALLGDNCSRATIYMTTDNNFFKWDAATVGFLPTGRKETFLGLRRLPKCISFSSALIHEFGHAVHSMLGIATPNVLFEKYMQSPEIKKFAFPFLNFPANVVQREIGKRKVGKNVIHIYKAFCKAQKKESQVDQALIEDKPEDVKKCTAKLEQKMLRFLKEDRDIASELYRLGEKASSNTVIKILRQMALLSWTLPEEINQILGIAHLGKTLYVNRLSDLDRASFLGKPFRYSHNAFPDALSDLVKKINRTKKIDFSPTKEAMRKLFELHGHDFNAYVEKVCRKAKRHA
ncbi:hypothetical protein FACS1894122_01220 [Alphaproteobacteria bacterium]|nr:hypothetical protein FACS1894122_01220 [Alphaproteobacteria bacterium]